MPRKRKKGGAASYKDPEAYLTYEQTGAAAERGYSLNEGTAPSFATQANAVSFDLGADDEARYSTTAVQKASQVRWDRKTKKFVKANQGGTDNVKLVKTESGAKLPASFKSGAFDEWKQREKIRIPNVGEVEMKGRNNMDHRKYRHKAGPTQDQQSSWESGGGRKGGKPKVFGKTADGKKKFLGPSHTVTRGGFGGGHIKGKGKGRPGQSVRNAGLKNVEQIRKERVAKDNRKARSNQPSRKNR